MLLVYYCDCYLRVLLDPSSLLLGSGDDVGLDGGDVVLSTRVGTADTDSILPSLTPVIKPLTNPNTTGRDSALITILLESVNG